MASRFAFTDKFYSVGMTLDKEEGEVKICVVYAPDSQGYTMFIQPIPYRNHVMYINGEQQDYATYYRKAMTPGGHDDFVIRYTTGAEQALADIYINIWSRR